MSKEVQTEEDLRPASGYPIAAAIDGRPFTSLNQNWTARVDGVHCDERSYWIQVSKEGDAGASVVVRCSRFATSDHVSAALTRWSAVPARSLRILRTMSAA